MGNDSNPLFTVIIPVKNRADYLHQTLRTCSLQDYDNLQIVVSDDGSTDHTREVVSEASRKDPRIRYVSPGQGVGMLDNFEFALDQVKPGYVIALGGDDGLLPYGISGMRDVLRETGQEMLAWPAPVFSYAGARTATGQLSLYRQNRTRIIESKDFLERQAKQLHYLSDNESPMFYVKGVTSTRLIEKVRSRSLDGRFYKCATPDGYSGIVLAGEVRSYAFSGKPFSIYGVSPSSQGMSYLSASDKAKERSEAFFSSVSTRPMHAELATQPYSPLIALMTADYLLTTRDLAGWPGYFSPIDYRNLLSKSIVELSHGLYAENRLARELSILANIAEQHGLSEFFRERVRRTSRFMRKSPLEGNAISPNAFFLDCKAYGIANIFDAAFVAHYAHQAASNATISNAWKMFTNSLGYRFRSLQKDGRFPPEEAWLEPRILETCRNA